MIRLTGGELRGRAIRSPAHPDTRPTQSKLRQALFNSIQFEIPDARVLDLFAGTGSLGFEAISRGAQSVDFVESAGEMCTLIRKSGEDLGVQAKIRVFSEPVERAIALLEAAFPYDLIFADPPYEQGHELRLLQNFPFTTGLQAGGRLILESSAHDPAWPDSIGGLMKVREKKYGDTRLTTYIRMDETP